MATMGSMGLGWQADRLQRKPLNWEGALVQLLLSVLIAGAGTALLIALWWRLASPSYAIRFPPMHVQIASMLAGVAVWWAHTLVASRPNRTRALWAVIPCALTALAAPGARLLLERIGGGSVSTPSAAGAYHVLVFAAAAWSIVLLDFILPRGLGLAGGAMVLGGLSLLEGADVAEAMSGFSPGINEWGLAMGGMAGIGAFAPVWLPFAAMKLTRPLLGRSVTLRP